VNVAGKFWNVVLEKDGEDPLDRSCEKVVHRIKEERNIVHTLERRKSNEMCHTLIGTVFLKHTVEGKIGGEIEVTGRKSSC
jgi:hypothetical protein